MEKAIHLLGIISLFYNVSHFFYAFEQIVCDIEEFDPYEVHKQSDMVCVEPREPSFTREVLHDDFHHGGIPIKKVAEREDPSPLISMQSFDEWFIILLLQIF